MSGSSSQSGSSLEAFNPSSEAFAQNPYPIYATLRERQQPYFYESANAFLLARYEDIDKIARNENWFDLWMAFCPRKKWQTKSARRIGMTCLITHGLSNPVC